MTAGFPARVRHVLLVQEAASVRSSWRGGHCLSVHRGHDIEWPADAEPAPRGGWCVIVDTPPTDIERLSSDGFDRGPIGRWQRRRFEREARRRRECDAVGWLGRHSHSGARAALQRGVGDERTVERLRDWQTTGVHIATILPIDAVMASAAPRSAEPRLWLLHAAESVRHVLVIDGVVCASRRHGLADCPAIDEEGSAREVLASVLHAHERWSIARLSVETCGLDPAAAQRLSERLARALADSGVALPIDWRTGDAEPDAFARTVSRAAASMPVRAAGPAASVYAELLAPERARREHRRLTRLTIATCAIALISAVHAASVGRQHARSANASNQERASVLAATGRLEGVLANLHPEPERADRYLVRSDTYARIAPIAPARLLRDIATVTTAHPAILLDGLAWALVPGEEELGHAPVDIDPTLFVGARPSDPQRTEVELVGRLVGAPPLRTAQRQTADFADAMAARPDVDACRLLASPLDSATHGRSADPASERTATSNWRLRCRWRVNDA